MKQGLWCFSMTNKEKNKINVIKHINGIEEIDQNCKNSIIEWVEHCYKLKHPLTIRDIENILSKAFEMTDNVNLLIPAVLKRAIEKGLYTNLYLKWNVNYGTV